MVNVGKYILHGSYGLHKKLHVQTQLRQKVAVGPELATASPKRFAREPPGWSNRPLDQDQLCAQKEDWNMKSKPQPWIFQWSLVLDLLRYGLHVDR